MAEISIIVPVYNAEKYLAECIDSILAQTFTDWELLLIDDGSTDSSPEICDRYAASDSRIRAIHKPNGGVSSARNLGLDNAKGKWIAFIDADDWIDRDYFETLMQDPSADIAMCGFKFQSMGSAPKEELPFQWTGDKLSDLSAYIMTVWTVTCGSIIRRELFETNNIRFPEGIKWCEDYHVIVRLLYFSRKTISINSFPYNYRQHGESLCHQMPENIFDHALKVDEDIVEFFNLHNSYQSIRKALAHRSLWHTGNYVLNTATFNRFLDHNPDKRHYIFSCSMLATNVKIIAWCLTHRLKSIASVLLKIRNFISA